MTQRSSGASTQPSFIATVASAGSGIADAYLFIGLDILHQIERQTAIRRRQYLTVMQEGQQTNH